VQKVDSITYSFSPGTNNISDSLTELLVNPYREKVNREMNQYICYSPASLEKGRPESKLGNLVADACMQVCMNLYHPYDGKPVDFTFLNYGGLRSSLPLGSINKGNIYELMPFENELVVLTLNGATVSKLLQYIASKGGEPVSNLIMEIKNRQPVNVIISAMPFDSKLAYKVLTSDYLANGGDQCFFFYEAQQREDLGLKIRDALISYFSKQDTLHTNLDHRIYIAHE
jgi:5'-nucleotidase